MFNNQLGALPGRERRPEPRTCDVDDIATALLNTQRPRRDNQ
jgi:hypothetical protein